MNHLRLIEHSLAHRTVGIRPGLLYVGGTFPFAAAGLKYRGAVNVYNAIGDCRVELISGSLPGGATLTMDNTNKQIVISWPAPASAVVQVPNGNFEQGNVGWELGDGWSIVPTIEGVPGNGTRMAMHNGGNTSYIVGSPVACAAGVSVTVTANWYPGYKNGENVDLYTILQFLDASKNAIPGGEFISPKLHGSSPTAFVPLAASGVSPSGTAYARAVGLCYRRKYARPVTLDDITWTITTTTVGTPNTGSYPLTLRVTDNGGRTADWTGTLVVYSTPTWAQGYETFEGTPGSLSKITSAAWLDGVWGMGDRSNGSTMSADSVISASGDPLVFYMNVNITNNRRFMRFDLGTRTWAAIDHDGPALGAGAGLVMRFRPQADWALCQYFDGVMYAWRYDAAANMMSYVGSGADTSGSTQAGGFKWAPDGMSFVTMGNLGDVRKWTFDPITGAYAYAGLAMTYGGYTGFDWQGNYIVLTNQGGTGIRVIDATTFAVIATNATAVHTQTDPGMSPDGRWIYAFSDTQLGVYEFDPVAATITLRNTYTMPPPAGTPSFRDCSFSRNRDYVSVHVNGTSTHVHTMYALNGAVATQLTTPTLANVNYEGLFLV